MPDLCPAKHLTDPPLRVGVVLRAHTHDARVQAWLLRVDGRRGCKAERRREEDAEEGGEVRAVADAEDRGFGVGLLALGGVGGEEVFGPLPDAGAEAGVSGGRGEGGVEGGRGRWVDGPRGRREKKNR